MTRTLLTRTIVLGACALGLAGCNATFWGNLVVLAVTVGIFVGTLSLGRRADAARSASRSASHSSTTRS